MYPILFKIGSWPLHTFGVMLAIGILVGSAVLMRETRRLGDPVITEERVQRLVWYIVLAVLIGGRALHVIVSWDYFSKHPGEIVAVWQGGLVMYGGMLAVFGTVIGYSLLNRMSLLRLCDLVAPAAFLGAAIGRWGCFFAGDDYGKPTHSWVGVTFPDREGTLAPTGIPLHPTQIYMSLKDLTIFAVCFWLTRRKRFDGQVAGTALMMYAVLRSIVELFRGDADRGFVFDGLMSTSQFISIFVFAAGLLILLVAPRKPTAPQAA